MREMSMYGLEKSFSFFKSYIMHLEIYIYAIFSAGTINMLLPLLYSWELAK